MEKLASNKRRTEGDFFGVSAIEAGYFGGVSQSIPNSPAPSYKLSPAMALVDWSPTAEAHSRSSSNNPSAASSLATSQQSKKKPSPLRLTPFDADMMHSPALTFGDIGGAYMSPVPSPRSINGARGSKYPSWVSPLDVHFSRTSTPSVIKRRRPTSYLPRLRFPREIAQTGLLIPTPTGSAASPNSESASIVSGGVSPQPTIKTQVVETPKSKTPTFSVFPQSATSLGPRQRQPSNLPNNGEIDRPSHHRNDKSNYDIPTPPTATSPSYYPPKSPKPAVPSGSGSRESMAGKPRVSAYRPRSGRSQSRHRAHSGSASSKCSNKTYITDEDGFHQRERRRRSRSFKATSKERSIPSSRSRERSHPQQNRRASLESNAFELDQPLESPFSNANAISTPVTESSSRSISTISSPSPAIERVAIELTLPKGERISAIPLASGRSASEVSQGSVGEFYDAHYRQPILDQRQILVNQGLNDSLHLET